MSAKVWLVDAGNDSSYSDYREDVLRAFLTESEAVAWCAKGVKWLEDNGFLSGRDTEWRFEGDKWWEVDRRRARCWSGKFVEAEVEYRQVGLWVESVELGTTNTGDGQ